MSGHRKYEQPITLWVLVGKNRPAYLSLRRYIDRRTKEGAEDPRDADGRTTLSNLYRCLPELRPTRDRDALSAINKWLSRNEAKMREIAREEAELALHRAGVRVPK